MSIFSGRKYRKVFAMSAITVFDRIKKLAERQGKRIVDVESDLGMSKNYLYKWKKSVPTSDKLARVADYFGVSVDYLLGRDEDLKKNGYFRMSTAGLSNDEIQEIKAQLKFAEQLALKNIKDKNKE